MSKALEQKQAKLFAPSTSSVVNEALKNIDAYATQRRKEDAERFRQS
jgi:hypothetical protein